MRENAQLLLSMIGPGTASRLGYSAAAERALRVELPRKLPEDAVKRARRDCAVLAGILEREPGRAGEFLEAVANGRLSSAADIAKALGLEESKLEKRGGGLIWLLAIAVGAAILLYPREAH